ncbi:MAG: hypothetical protein ACMG6E_05075, partial [Candidatus Roizmanbacteria bacterium]
VLTSLLREPANKALHDDLRRGDVLHCVWVGDYRNLGKYLWDGKKVVSLDFDLDDYGSIPPQFSALEFPLGYFSDAIENNRINWLSPYQTKQVTNDFRLQEVPMEVESAHDLVRISKVTIGATTFSLLIDLNEHTLLMTETRSTRLG